jgi:hypothetical protein
LRRRPRRAIGAREVKVDDDPGSTLFLLSQFFGRRESRSP